MFGTAPPSEQRSGYKPIAFTLQTSGGLASPVTLKIRPEDLTRTEPQRVTVTQTLGRKSQGWVDHFGEGLPSLQIAGHTGWRTSQGSGEDGAAAFETLNELVSHRYPEAIQEAINRGEDPRGVRLIFVDMLDNFSWAVVPQSFVLRRSRSRPLLFQYNITMQCIDTDLESPLTLMPFGGDLFSGLTALEGVVKDIEGYATKVEGWINEGAAAVNGVITPISRNVHRFMDLSSRVFDSVNGVVDTAENAASSVANNLIGIASDVSQFGMNLHRTIANVTGLPAHIMHNFMQVAGAYSEAFCVLNNSLKPKKVYQNYDGLFGASNCSSTTGGSPPSAYKNTNAFQLMSADKSPVTVDEAARRALNDGAHADPVLAAKSMGEWNRLSGNAVDGTTITGKP
ncbi:hypothetical protein E0G74_00965 [Salmonella enterica]|nr:hypothetical protein [Salmonella enterica]